MEILHITRQFEWHKVNSLKIQSKLFIKAKFHIPNIRPEINENLITLSEQRDTTYSTSIYRTTLCYR